MARSQRYTVEQVAAALQAGRGLKAVAARRLGCERQTVDNYLRRYPRLQALCEDARQEIIDLAESALARAVENGEPWAVSLTLKTLGRSRGYGEAFKAEHSGAVGLTLADLVLSVRAQEDGQGGRS